MLGPNVHTNSRQEHKTSCGPWLSWGPTRVCATSSVPVAGKVGTPKSTGGARRLRDPSPASVGPTSCTGLATAAPSVNYGITSLRARRTPRRSIQEAGGTTLRQRLDGIYGRSPAYGSWARSYGVRLPSLSHIKDRDRPREASARPTLILDASRRVPGGWREEAGGRGARRMVGPKARAWLVSIRTTSTVSRDRSPGAIPGRADGHITQPISRMGWGGKKG